MENVGAGGIRQKVRGPGKLGQLLGLPRVRRHVYIGAFRLVGATASVTDRSGTMAHSLGRPNLRLLCLPNLGIVVTHVLHLDGESELPGNSRVA